MRLSIKANFNFDILFKQIAPKLQSRNLNLASETSGNNKMIICGGGSREAESTTTKEKPSLENKTNLINQIFAQLCRLHHVKSKNVLLARAQRLA
jgi:hypothetical protein